MDLGNPQVIELDVRPYLRKKLEPFQLIMDHVKKLEEEDTFVLHATFKPRPLLGLMRTKGFAYKTEKIAKDHWMVTFVPKNRKHELNVEQVDETESETTPNEMAEDTAQHIELDNRGLEPPQPMIRTLSALDRIKPGGQVKIHNDRVPMFLIEELHSLGYPYEVEEQPDGSAKVTITKQ